MFSETTNGITVRVISKYHPEQSRPAKNQYVFGYTVEISNESNDRVQLLSRHWIITDAYGKKREVKGDGVIGQQPILKRGEKHIYNSWCPISTNIGKMEGAYTMQNLLNKEIFKVSIPEFMLIRNDIEN